MERTNSPGDAARSKGPVTMRPKGDEPAADNRRAQFGERRPVAGALEEAYELSQVIAVPTDCPRTSTGNLEGNPVFVDELAEAQGVEPGLQRDLCDRATRLRCVHKELQTVNGCRSAGLAPGRSLCTK